MKETAICGLLNTDLGARYSLLSRSRELPVCLSDSDMPSNQRAHHHLSVMTSKFSRNLQHAQQLGAEEGRTCKDPRSIG